MPPVMLLHEPNLPFEARRLVGLLTDRVPGTQAVEVRPSRLLPVTADLTRRRGQRRVIHAFGLKALAVAVLSSDADVLFTSLKFPRRRDVAWLRAVLRYRPVRIVCGSDAERRAWVTGGVPIERCTLIRPGVSLATSNDARTAARAKFGYDDSHRVVFLPLPALGKDRAAAVWAGCLLNVLDNHVKVLAWAAGGHESLDVLRTRLIGSDVMRIAHDADPADAFAASDVVLLPPSTYVPPTMIAMAMASGKPVVGIVTPQICEMIEDRHTALLTGGRTPKILAERVIDALNDAELARKVGDRARAEVYEYFLLSRLVADYRTLYAAADAMATPDAGSASVAT